MEELVLKVKRLHKDALLPLKKDGEDAGWDLFSIEDVEIKPGDIKKVRTGIALGIPKGYRVHIRDRSSVGGAGLIVTGGVIDRGYTGEIFTNLAYIKTYANKDSYYIRKGDRITQFVLEEDPQFVTLVEVDDLKETNRGGKGFGSSGK